MDSQGNERDVEDGFYIVAFDIDKIDRMDMDAVESMEQHLHPLPGKVDGKKITLRFLRRVRGCGTYR